MNKFNKQTYAAFSIFLSIFGQDREVVIQFGYYPKTELPDGSTCDEYVEVNRISMNYFSGSPKDTEYEIDLSSLLKDNEIYDAVEAEIWMKIEEQREAAEIMERNNADGREHGYWNLI